MEFFCITCKSNPVLHSGEQGWLEGCHGVRLHHIRFSIPVSKEGWRDDMEFFCIICKSNKVLHSGEQGWLEGRHGVLLHHLQEQSSPPLRRERRVGEMTWSSSASPARAIRFSIQVSKDDWRDDMEFFCITCKSNPVLQTGDQSWL